MRLTIFSPGFRTGGTERAVVNMANHWDSQGHSITILTPDDGSTQSLFSIAPSIQHIPLNILYPSHGIWGKAYNLVKRLHHIRTTIRETTPDGVISFIDTTNIRTILATRLSGIPVIVSERTDPALHPISPLWNFMRNISYPLADAIVVQTQGAKQRFHTRIKNKTVIIPNPVITPLSANTMQKDSKNIVCLTRLSPEKAPLTMLRAFIRIASKFPEWTLTFVGDGILAEQLKRKVVEHNLEERVIFAGWQKDVGSWLCKAEIITLTSQYEGFPNSLCEGMAHGLPAISTATIGASDVIRHGVDGLLVKVGDDKVFAEALSLLLGNSQLRKEMSARAIEVLDRFGVNHIMTQWDALLTRLTSK